MSESVESFVNKLQTEGIEIGKKAAEKIKKSALHEKEKVLTDAKAEAEKIILKATRDAEQRACMVRNELELAVRDAVLKLGESVSDLLTAILFRRVENELSDPDYIGEIVRTVIKAYANADAHQASRIEINLSKKMRDRLNEGVFEDLLRDLHANPGKRPIQFTLSKAGFEYSIHGSTVEVSPESVSELLAEMVDTELFEIIDKVVGRMS